MASSSCSWCSCVRLPTNCVTGHFCSRCSLSVVVGRSGCRSASFSFPTYVGCVLSCDGHFWAVIIQSNNNKRTTKNDSVGFMYETYIKIACYRLKQLVTSPSAAYVSLFVNTNIGSIIWSCIFRSSNFRSGGPPFSGTPFSAHLVSACHEISSLAGHV